MKFWEQIHDICSWFCDIGYSITLHISESHNFSRRKDLITVSIKNFIFSYAENLFRHFEVKWCRLGFIRNWGTFPVVSVCYLLCATLLCRLGFKLSYLEGKNNKVGRCEDKEWHTFVNPMFFHPILALASVYIRGASSKEGALVFFRFPVASTLRSVQTAIFTFLLIYI